VLGARTAARFTRNRSAVVGAGLVGLLVVFAVVGPLFAKHGPLESDFVHGVSPDLLPVGPSAEFPLGADRIFRDVFARLAYAGRLSLVVAIAATAIASAIGAAVGVLAGWTEGRRVRVPWEMIVAAVGAIAALVTGWPRVAAVVAMAGGAAAVVRWRLTRGREGGPPLDVDGLLMRVVDVLLAFPFLLLVMAIGAAFEQTSAVTIFVTLGITGWLGTARVVRAKTMQVRSQEYVVAARALGQSTPTLLVKHILPNVAGTLIVTSTVQVAQMIVADSVLSYLGVGIAPPAPTWGRMLYEGQDYYQVAPWLVAAPGAAILLAVWGFNMLGEGLRDALDPHEA
jgi:ABC-type dipeptide/oligopeptide/nickel transport system permease subunit